MRNSYITSQVSCQKHSRQARQPEETKLPWQNLGEPASVEQRLAPHSRQVDALLFSCRTVKSDAIKATYRDGILEIHVPKAEEAKPKPDCHHDQLTLRKILSFEE